LRPVRGGDRFVDPSKLFQAEPLAEVHVQGGIKGGLITKLIKPEEELQIGILADLFHRLLVADTETSLDDQSAKSQSGGLGRSPLVDRSEVFRLERVDQIPGNHLCQVDPAVIASELTSEG